MSANRLLEAALEFCEQEQIIRALRATDRRCTETEAGDPSIGDYGVGPCRLQSPDNREYCAACLAFEASRGPWKAAGYRRRLAKERMMRAFAAKRATPAAEAKA